MHLRISWLVNQRHPDQRFCKLFPRFRCLSNASLKGALSLMHAHFTLVELYLSFVSTCVCVLLELPTILVFPYFNQTHVQGALPSFSMLDYQVRRNRAPA